MEINGAYTSLGNIVPQGQTQQISGDSNNQQQPLEQIKDLLQSGQLTDASGQLSEQALALLTMLLEHLKSQALGEPVAASEADTSSAVATKGGSNKTGGGSHTAGSGGTSNEFLWKPNSDKNSNLVVLLPAKMTGDVTGLKVLDSSGKTTLATGEPHGAGNGNREHFRFDKPGSSFPDGCIVEAQMRDGSTRQFKIGETSERNTKQV